MATVNVIAAQTLTVGQVTDTATIDTSAVEGVLLQLTATQMGTTDSMVRLVAKNEFGQVKATLVGIGTDTKDVLLQEIGTTLYVFIECMKGTAMVQADNITGTGTAGLALTLADVSSAMFTADATGRGKFANQFVNTTLLEDNSLAASVAGRGKMQTGFFTEAKATDAFDAGAITGALLKAATATLTKMDLRTGLSIQAFDGADATSANVQTAITSTIGQRVWFILGQVKANTGAHSFLVPVVGTDFESTISVTNKIVQLQASGNLSANTYVAFLLPAGA
jgi:hypothetical protein